MSVGNRECMMSVLSRECMMSLGMGYVKYSIRRCQISGGGGGICTRLFE